MNARKTASQRREERAESEASRNLRRVSAIMADSGEVLLSANEAAGAHKSFKAGDSVESVLAVVRILRRMDAERGFA